MSFHNKHLTLIRIVTKKGKVKSSSCDNSWSLHTLLHTAKSH